MPWAANSLHVAAGDLQQRAVRSRMGRRGCVREMYQPPSEYVADAYADAAKLLQSRLSALKGQK